MNDEFEAQVRWNLYVDDPDLLERQRYPRQIYTDEISARRDAEMWAAAGKIVRITRTVFYRRKIERRRKVERRRVDNTPQNEEEDV